MEMVYDSVALCKHLHELTAGGPLYYLYEYFDALRSSKQITEAEYKHAVGLINLRSNQFEKEIHAEFLERIRRENNAL